MSKSFQVVKYKVGKNTFEIMTKTGSALKYREGKITSVSEVLFADEIYADQSKGERANDEDIKAAFQTTDYSIVAKEIIAKGELQLTTAERKEKVDEKRREIVNYIHKYYIDPRSKTPHPVQRIENALTQMKVNLDPWVSAEKQFHDKIEKKLPEVIPVKKTEIAGTLKVPHAYVGVAQGVVKKWCSVGREDWSAEGMEMEVSVVPGDYDAFCIEMNDITKGNYSLDVAGQNANAASAVEATGRGKHGSKNKAKAGGGSPAPAQGGGKGGRGGKSRDK